MSRGTDTTGVRGAPADVTSFVGRRWELAQSRSLLSRTRLLTLTGAGGVGKTRLALRLAGEVARAFKDGVWLVDLAPLRDEALLVSTVVNALGMSEKATRSPLDQLTDYLADKHMLIILDNCEHMVEECALLAGCLLGAARALRILATSRQALGIDGELLMTVPPLPVPETPVTAAAASTSPSVELLTERVAKVIPDFGITPQNADAAVGICRRLDGIPLAIELASVQARTLSLEEILDRLDNRFGLLTKKSRGRPPRHQTLRAAIEWSYEMCSSREQILWARMSVFAGGCDLEAIEQVCAGGEIAPDEVFGLVAGLVDKSVIFRQGDGTPARYRLLETVREFGSEMLSSAGQQADFRERHWRYYQGLVQSAGIDIFGPRQTDWLARLRLEVPDLRTALEYGLNEPGETQNGLEAAATLHLMWVITGSLREGCRWLQRAIQLNPEPTTARARGLYACAALRLMLGEAEAALSMAYESSAIARQFEDDSALAYSALWAGAAKMYQGDYSAALSLLEKALVGHRAIGDVFGTYLDLRHLSMAALATEDPRASSFAKECLAICESHDAELSKSWALWVVGLVQIRQGDIERGIDRVRASLRLKSLVQDLVGEAHCLETLAWAAVMKGEAQRAARLLGAAHTIWGKAGSSLVEFGYLEQLRSPFEVRIQKNLGEDAYLTFFNQGREAGIENVLGYALMDGVNWGAESGPGKVAESVLTPREQEVADLIGQGLSNKEIAKRLVIAQRTAEGHVEHILTKLGFRSRTQIASWVAEDESP